MFRQPLDVRGGFPPKSTNTRQAGSVGKKPKVKGAKKPKKIKRRKRTGDPFARERKAEQAFRFGERRSGLSGRSVYDPTSLLRFHQSAMFNQARDQAEASRRGGTFTGTSIGEEKRVKEAQEADRELKKLTAETQSRFVGALEKFVDTATSQRRPQRQTTTQVEGSPEVIILEDKGKKKPPELTDAQKRQVRQRAIERGKKPETTIEEIKTISLDKPTEEAPEPLPLSAGTQQISGEQLQQIAIKARQQKLGYRQDRVPEDRISRQTTEADKQADLQTVEERRKGFVSSGTSGGGSTLLRPRPSPNNPSQSIFALQRQESGTTVEGKSILRPETEPSPFQQPQVGLQKQISALDLSAEPEEPVEEEEDIPDLKDEPLDIGTTTTTTTDSPTTAINKTRDELRKIIQEPQPEPEEEKFQPKAFPKPERTLLASPFVKPQAEPTPEPEPEPTPEPEPQSQSPQPKPKKKRGRPKKPKPEPEPERIEEIVEVEPEPQVPVATEQAKQESLVPTDEPPLLEENLYGELLQESGIFAEGSRSEGWLPTKYIIYDEEGLIGQKEPDYYYYVMSARGKNFGIVDIENEDLQGWNSISKTRFDKLLKEGKIIFQ